MQFDRKLTRGHRLAGAVLVAVAGLAGMGLGGTAQAVSKASAAASQESVAGQDSKKSQDAQTGKISPEEARAIAAARSITPESGRIALPDSQATLDLGQAYDFYDKDDTRRILVEIWGNPDDSAEGVLGMVMPHGASPLSDAWGAVLSYEQTGYVADDDAQDTDYAEILKSLQERSENANERRKQMGFAPMHVVGWAEQPAYDAGTHSVVWARDLMVEGAPSHTLNYDFRLLGRAGVLSMNFVAPLGQLPQIRQAAKDFADHASFDPGHRYADYNAATDTKAEYGVGGLIAAGLGVAAAKKLGLLAILAKFLKPIAIAVIAGFAVMRRKVMALFNRGGGDV